MNVDNIKKLIDLMNANNLTELEIDEDGVRVRLQKGHPPAEGVFVTPTSAPPAAAPNNGLAVPQPTPEKSTDEENVIPAPMVGTFYLAPGPDEPSFVEAGDTVTPETVVCIIEAMKVMNEIKAGVEGEIAEVLTQNGTPVEYGQALFKLAAS